MCVCDQNLVTNRCFYHHGTNNILLLLLDIYYTTDIFTHFGCLLTPSLPREEVVLQSLKTGAAADTCTSSPTPGL